ncbi:MBL fold metallo-hydrolase [Salinifilum ghardaiensis]
MPWHTLAAGVRIRTHSDLDLTVGLVTGTRAALVVDSRGDAEQGAELAREVRELTALPVQLVVTHGHFDHCFGGGALRAESVWAHRDYTAFLAATAEQQRQHWAEHFAEGGDAARAAALRRAVPVAADRTVAERAHLDLGGRTARFVHFGRGHTDHDLLVLVEDAGVVFTGDLVEQAGPPDFEHAHPAQWPSALDALLADRSWSTAVPGHGEPVDRAFVRRQRDDLAALAGLCRAAADGEIGEGEALSRSPFPAETTAAALHRCGLR